MIRAIFRFFRFFPLRERMAIATHAIGVTAVYMGVVYGVSWLAGQLAGPNAANVASAVAAISLFLPWLAGLSLGKAP